MEQDGTPAEGTTTSGKVFRAWMDVKAALARKDRKAILASCEFGEDTIQQAYRDALQSEDLPSEFKTFISEQQSCLKKSHDKIKSLRDNA